MDTIDLTTDEDGSDAPQNENQKDTRQDEISVVKDMLIKAMVENQNLKTECSAFKAKYEKEAKEKQEMTLKLGYTKRELEARNHELMLLRLSTNSLNIKQEKLKPESQESQKSIQTPPKTPAKSSKAKTPARKLYSPPRNDRNYKPPPKRRQSCYARYYARSSRSPSRKVNFSLTSKSPSKVNGLKFIIENIDKSIEQSTLLAYFKDFGDVEVIRIHQKGIDKEKVKKCSGFLKYRKLNNDNFLNVTHAVKGSLLAVRTFSEGVDKERIDDDWSSDELKELTNKSPLRKRQRSYSRGRSRAKSSYRGKSRHRNRSSSSSYKSKSPHNAHNDRNNFRQRRQSFYQSSSNRSLSPSKPKTRTIGIVIMFKNWSENLLRNYFLRFGEIENVKAKNPKTRIIYLRFKKYDSAEKALQCEYHMIEGEKYYTRPALDF